LWASVGVSSVEWPYLPPFGHLYKGKPGAIWVGNGADRSDVISTIYSISYKDMRADA
jgi:hypothetical protein